MLLVALPFLVLTAIDLWQRWDGRAVKVEPGAALLALMPVLAGAVLQGASWITLLGRMTGRRPPWLAALALYLDSQLARYTPGKVGLPLVRMEGAPRLGASRGLVGISVLIETLSWAISGAVLGLLALFLIGAPDVGLGRIAGWATPPALGLSLVACACLIAVDRRRLPAKVRGWLPLEGSGPLAPPGLPALQLLYWLTWSAHGYLLARAFGAPPSAALLAVAFSPLANVLGFAVLAAPAGVGVREAVLVGGLSPALGSSAALGLAALSRIQSLVADLGVWLIVRLLDARQRREGDTPR